MTRLPLLYEFSSCQTTLSMDTTTKTTCTEGRRSLNHDLQPGALEIDVIELFMNYMRYASMCTYVHIYI